MSDLYDFTRMIRRSSTHSETRVQKFEKGYTPGGSTVNKDDDYTVIELEPGSRGAYQFIFTKDGEMLCSEPCGF